MSQAALCILATPTIFPDDRAFSHFQTIGMTKCTIIVKTGLWLKGNWLSKQIFLVILTCKWVSKQSFVLRKARILGWVKDF